MADKTDISCPGASDGVIVPFPLGGQAPYQFNWSNGSRDSINDNLQPGIYELTITDRKIMIIIILTMSFSFVSRIFFLYRCIYVYSFVNCYWGMKVTNEYLSYDKWTLFHLLWTTGMAVEFYCLFFSANKADIWCHWKFNHFRDKTKLLINTSLKWILSCMPVSG